MRIRSLALAVAAIALVVVVGSVHAQSENRIRGKVVTDQGRNVAQVLVVLETGTGQVIGQTVTNSEGDFAFGGLLDTSYYVLIKEPSWHSVRERVDFAVKPSETTNGVVQYVSIALTPRGGMRANSAGIVFAQDVPPAARTAFERGQRLTRESKGTEAVAAYREAVTAFPDYFDANYALAAELTKAGNANEAMAALDRARAVNPKDARVYAAFGSLLVTQRKYAVAAAAYGEAARLAPNEPQYPLVRAEVLIDQATLLDPAKPDSAKARKTLLDAAGADLDRAFELSGRTLAAVHLQRARMHERAGEPARAAEALEAYLKQNPGASNAAAIRESIAKLRKP